MDETTKIIQDFYDVGVQNEWNCIAGRPKFMLTCRMLVRYIKPGDKVLDIGGDLGCYLIYLAEKGCDVTLFNLSAENTKFAMERAAEQGIQIKTITGDAREADKLINDKYDHVLLMGPLYHLFEEIDRITTVNSALKLLKRGGIIFVSFLNLFLGIIYYMKHLPDISADPGGDLYLRKVIAGKSFGSDAFTKAFFMDSREILPFMAQNRTIVDLWLDFSEAVWEQEEFLNYSEHLMYVGRNI